MAPGLSLGQQDQVRLMIEENHRHDDQSGSCQRSPSPVELKDLGKIYIEARVSDDFQGDLVQVGYCAMSNISFY
jgi:hypothetical protein